MSKSALIFGASGVTGWAFVNEMLNDYPKKQIWTKVHALTNRPLKAEDSLWPKDDRLNIVSGIDLLKGSQDDLERELRNIDAIEKVTHVYYLGRYSFSVFKTQTDIAQHTKHQQTEVKSIKMQMTCSRGLQLLWTILVLL